ncbi:hypothetical protein Taro_035790 [Colocasia esculenta]|uniref:Uncharacterized protein n=1 Tax=Colocasia esculenta TaxID=4460 RepID=A0A843WE99_COLES|nr:hypothetical protein [Colocasia esculenta]
MEEVDPQQPETQLGDSDEEEYTSDQNESDNEDANAEFDISPASEDEMENIWFEDDVRLLQVGGERVVGGDFFYTSTTGWTYDLCTSPSGSRTHNLCTSTTGPTASASPSHMASGSTPPPSEPVHAHDDTSHHEGEGSYNETMRAVWINDGYRNHRFTEHSDELRARSVWTTTARANFKHLLYNVRRNVERVCVSTDKNRWKEHGPVWMRKEYWMELCVTWGREKWNENSIKAKQNRAAHHGANEAQLKWPPQFQELFDQTHKKKGTDDYISQKAREVALYSRGMDERYGDDSQCPELDPDIWVAASGAPKKGHVYGFGHSLGTARVISSSSSSVSHATSPFTTPTTPGGSSNAAPTMTSAQFRKIVNETVSQNISTIVSHTVSQTLAQLGYLGDRAPPAQQPPVRILFD